MKLQTGDADANIRLDTLAKVAAAMGMYVYLDLRPLTATSHG
ncbi:MAG TPA: hypothetical protein VFK04_18240 [Gemmatimonadaceae bacterium]|nr:hypothetical protein [Gemmatimonadaceae bacterium]